MTFLVKSSHEDHESEGDGMPYLCIGRSVLTSCWKE